MELKTYVKSWLHTQHLSNPADNEMVPMQVSTSAMQSAVVSLSKRDTKTLTEKVNKLLASDSFMAAISDQVGEPRSDESEDEFVVRAKEAARQVIRQMLLASK